MNANILLELTIRELGTEKSNHSVKSKRCTISNNRHSLGVGGGGGRRGVGGCGIQVTRSCRKSRSDEKRISF